MRTPSDQPLVTVETNTGGDLLLTAVRQALAHLPVRVEPVVSTLAILRSTVTEQAIESAAIPVLEQAVKALTPEAEAVVRAVEAHLVAEVEHLKSEIDNSHNGVITWLRNTLGATPAATAPDPTPAVPAPQP